MITWERFAEWLTTHDLPTTTVQSIQFLPTSQGIHLRAEVLKLGEDGNQIACGNGPEAHALTEVLIRPMVSFPRSTEGAPVFSLTSFKAALVHVLGIGEDEARAVVAAIEADLAPMLAAFKAELLADLTAAIADGKVDAEKLAEDVAAKVLAALGKTTTPAEPTTNA